MTPDTALVYRPYPGVLPPPPSGRGRWGDLAMPNTVFSLSMVCERPVRWVGSALREAQIALFFANKNVTQSVRILYIKT